MVKAESNLKLLPPFILVISKVFECIGVAALHSYLTRVLWFWVTYGVKEGDRHLKLLPQSIVDTYTVFEHIDMLSIGLW